MKESRRLFTLLFFLSITCVSLAGGADPSYSPFTPPKTGPFAHPESEIRSGMMGEMMHQMAEENREMKKGLGAGVERGPMHGVDGSPSGRGLMRPLHTWIGCLMAYSQEIGLLPDQVKQLDDVITDHLMSFIRKQAEVRALRVQLSHALRARSIDLQSVEAILKEIADQGSQLQMEGVRVYAQILELLTEEQESKAGEMIGTPFAPPWEGIVTGPCRKRTLFFEGRRPLGSPLTSEGQKTEGSHDEHHE
jgi:Spy/CpxP family protein refolding chaperone